MSTTTMEHTESVDYKDRPKYFAVPDPDTGDMTYWFEDRRGTLKPWPQSPKPARYGPILYTKAGDGCQHVVPEGLSGSERDAWVRRWFDTIKHPWNAKIRAAIAADPMAAHARFARWQSHCFVCGRALEDDDSKVWGVGPVCRPRVPPGLLQASAREIGRMHGHGVAPDADRIMRDASATTSHQAASDGQPSLF